MSFRAPVRDILFSLRAAADLPRLQAGWPELDSDTVEAILTAAGDFATESLAPLNQKGDRAGAQLVDGRVQTPEGFADAYRSFAAQGWLGLTAETEFGGQGLPRSLAAAAFEMFNAANMAFALCPTLSQSAIEALQAHGSARQQALYLPKLISGAWTGTMNLTEPQAGSDLAALSMRAEPEGDFFRLTGQKIFITWGDHDCAENIVHMVLARLPDAPPGVKGISLFLAPKFLPDANGAPGEANALRVVGLERKLGIHASPTCVMAYEGAQAELIGQPNQGLAQMFTMMNAARLLVGVQGVGIAERAYQQALAYALERRQGRSAWTQEASAPIFDHPDVRRMLIRMKAKIEAARGICLMAAAAADRDDEAREALLIPIAKAWATDVGVEAASLAVQVHGGMGYIEETGAAQHLRDARIAPIYEGTNGIQAIDLVGRKLGDGASLAALIADIKTDARGLEGALAPIGARLEKAAECATECAEWLRNYGGPDALAGASAFLTLLGDVVGGWVLARGARMAASGETTGDAKWLAGKIALAHFYAETVLAPAAGAAGAIVAGAKRLEISATALQSE